ncbi:MAG: SDR family oxidoreductase, partial [Gammaproteobacteria bacterium]|nr:SDR family oxidoreductase [Gammaproteobacteria bacterium]
LILSMAAFPLNSPAAAGLREDRPTVLITGSNRGIGLGFVEHYAAEGWNVIATCRTPEKADDLKALQAKFPQVVVEQLDVTDHARIDQLAAEYEGQPIDLLVNNAAILGPLPEQKIGGLDYELFQQVMAINVYGPMKMTEAFADHVAASDQKKVVALSSGLSSIKMTSKMPGFYYYRSSKSALNMVMRGMRTDLRDRGVIVALIAPGMVGTQLLYDSGWRGKSLTPAESVAGMSAHIAQLTLEDPGEIVNTDGKIIPW